MSSNKQQRYEQWAEQAVMYPFPLFAHEPHASRPESPLIPPSPAHIKDKPAESQDDFSSLLSHIKSLNLQQKEVNALINEAAKLSRTPTPYPSPLPNGKLKVNELRLMDEGFIEECGQPGILSPGNTLHKNTAFSLSPLIAMTPSPNPPPIILEPIENPIISKINGKSKIKHKPPPILMYSQDSVRSSVSSNMDASVTFSTRSRSGHTFGSQTSTPSHIDDITTTDDEGMVSDISEDIDDLTLAEILSMGKESSKNKLDALRNLPLDNKISWNNLKNSPRLKHVLQLVPGAQTPPGMRQSPMKSPYPPSLPMSMDDVADLEGSKLKDELELDEESLKLDFENSKLKEELLKAVKLFNKSNLNHVGIEEPSKNSDFDGFKLKEELLEAIKLFNKSNLNHVDFKESSENSDFDIFKLKEELLKAIKLFNKSNLNHIELEEGLNQELTNESNFNNIEQNRELSNDEELSNLSNITSFKLKQDLIKSQKSLNESNLDKEKLIDIKKELLKAIKIFEKSNLNQIQVGKEINIDKEISQSIETDRNLLIMDNDRFKRRLTRLYYELNFHRSFNNSNLYGKLLNPKKIIKLSISKLFILLTSPTFTILMLAVIIGSQFKDYANLLDFKRNLLL